MCTGPVTQVVVFYHVLSSFSFLTEVVQLPFSAWKLNLGSIARIWANFFSGEGNAMDLLNEVDEYRFSLQVSGKTKQTLGYLPDYKIPGPEDGS